MNYREMFRERILPNDWGGSATKLQGKRAASYDWLRARVVGITSRFPITTRSKWEHWLEFLVMSQRISESAEMS